VEISLKLKKLATDVVTESIWQITKKKMAKLEVIVVSVITLFGVRFKSLIETGLNN